MAWIHSRIGRVRGYGRLIVALVAGLTALAGVATLLADRFGLWGVVVFTALLGGGFLGVLLLPETAWTRLTADPQAISRREAIDAFTECLIDADELRGRLFRELPSAEQMEKAITEWADSAANIIVTHAIEWRADFGGTEPLPARRYTAGDGRSLSAAQSRAMSHFDLLSAQLQKILEQVRAE